MELFILGLGVIMVGALAALAMSARPHRAGQVAVLGMLVGGALALMPVLMVLCTGDAQSLLWNWGGMPAALGTGGWRLEIDSLSAFFLVSILSLAGLTSIYGLDYLKRFAGKASVGLAWFWFGLMVTGLALVVVARHAVLFLMAWEVMAVSSFFLVTFEDELERVRTAGWTYLVATHVGTAFLFFFFIILGRQAGSLDFAKFATATATASSVGAVAMPTGLLFVFAVIGFGAKAGYFPLHVWMPEAYRAAPCHVAALMSGAMSKVGIYGLLRALTFLGPPPLWWGWMLVIVGATGGILGILFAMAQDDLKRLLAYSSMENIGIITMGLGLGLIGQSQGIPSLMVLGFGGALLHVWNHGMFKSLLFLGAGTLAHMARTRNLCGMGGLLKGMPWTGSMFIIGSAAICGLPPLNGFVSEFLIYLGAFHAVAGCETKLVIPAMCVIISLALIGGLAIACFTKACGMALLGEPKQQSNHGHDASFRQRVVLGVLAGGCVLAGVFGPILVLAVTPVLGQMGSGATALVPAFSQAMECLAGITLVTIMLVGGSLWLVVRRRRLLATREVGRTVTWDCGYVKPTVRMQYTASSFVQPLTELFRSLLGLRVTVEPPHGGFPTRASFSAEMPDVVQEKALRPFFLWVASRVQPLRRLQHGRVQLYVLYIAITLLILLLWKL